MSEEKYWIIPSVCTYRDFTKKNFDESIGDNFFTKRNNEQKNDEKGVKKNDEVCKRQKSTTSLDSGVEDKELLERYSTESGSSNSDQIISNETRKSYRKQSTEELIVRLNQIKKQNESVEVKPKPKLQLRNFRTGSSLESYVHPQRMSRISTVSKSVTQFKCTGNTPILLSKRSCSTEKVPIVKKSKVARSISLKNNSTGTSQSFHCKLSPLKKTTPASVAKCLSTKISCFFSSRRSTGRTASEPPEFNRKTTSTVDSQTSGVKIGRTNSILENSYSNELRKGRVSKGKIVNIIERLSRNKK
ncbi:Hypothetical protein SRAE_1000250300 [Strongyloides ratti]|uniref:Uncharacterized protein n=1 Tax=Strongyloides ratti TaxID=34506 RepID=A0A090L826_STRRB|nr:Hypothetical protein SRAE_1000250300 [Strongyloides ratti]CEF64248.1 Hypothetical protein SRAE_1000250300 [Strongyloides ratti]